MIAFPRAEIHPAAKQCTGRSQFLNDQYLKIYLNKNILENNTRGFIVVRVMGSYNECAFHFSAYMQVKREQNKIILLMPIILIIGDFN